jgi:phosphate/sulfate permease
MRSRERIAKHGRAKNALALSTSCYVAFAIGSNNVANVVGPLPSKTPVPSRR